MYSHITEYNNQFQNYELLGVNQIFKLKFKLFHIKITKLSNIDVKFSFSEKLNFNVLLLRHLDIRMANCL